MSKEEAGQVGISRRSFVKTAAVAAGATALTYSAQPVLRTLAADYKAGQAADAGEQIFRVVCQPNCGQAHCGLVAHVRDGKLVKTAAVLDNPDPRFDRRGCVKGLSHVQWVYNAERIKYPMKRAGERGEGKWERITWDEAITTIADKFNGLRKDYGNQSIAVTSMTGSYGMVHGTYGAVYRFRCASGATLPEYCIDWAAAVGFARVFSGSGTVEDMGNGYWDMPNARTIFAWGWNITESSPQNWHWMADAIENGTKLVVVDPRLSGVATKADTHVRLRPGSDTVLALSMMQVIIENGLENKDFLRKTTVAPFLVRNDTKQFLRANDLTGTAPKMSASSPTKSVEPYMVWNPATGAVGTSDEVAESALEGSYVVNGIKVTTAFQLLKDLVDEYTPEAASKLTDVSPKVIQEIAVLYATNGPATIHIGYGFDKYYNGDVTAHALSTLASITGNIGIPGGSVGFNAEMKGGALHFNLEYMAPGFKFAPSIPWVVFLDVLKDGTFKGKPYPIKAMLNLNGNVVSNMADQRETIDVVLPKLELIVTADSVMTDTCRYSDIVLPATHWFETNELTTPFGGYLSYVQLSEKALEPAFEAKSNLDVLSLLAAKMGIGQHFDRTDEQFMEFILDQEAPKKLGITLPALKERKAIFNFAPGAGNGVANPELKFATASGRLEFYQPNPVPRMDWGQEFDADFYRLPRFQPPAEAWPDNPLHAKYPLVNNQEHPRWRAHTTFGRIPWLKELDPEPIIKLSRADADARGIKSGDTVEAFNDRGSVTLKAIVDDGLPPGMTNIPKGWERHQFIKGGYQELTARHVNPMNANQAYSDVLIEVKKA
ncbi:MAG: molybdopterin-dependent oxidoreductase [Coriobacteriia bacterium]|nr:molybdopterin-dependent oxidoreductase [Coriobacteriia bacterium]